MTSMEDNESLEKWAVSAHRSDRLETGEFCPRQPYLELYVPKDAKSVQRIVIQTVSHDQGMQL